MAAVIAVVMGMAIVAAARMPESGGGGDGDGSGGICDGDGGDALMVCQCDVAMCSAARSSMPSTQQSPTRPVLRLPLK